MCEHMLGTGLYGIMRQVLIATRISTGWYTYENIQDLELVCR